MEIDDNEMIEMMIDIISLTGEYVAKSDANEMDYDEKALKKYRKLVISAYIYIVNLEELLKGG